MRGLVLKAAIAAIFLAAEILGAASAFAEGPAPVDLAAQKRRKAGKLPRCQGAPQCLPSFIARLKTAPFPLRRNDDGTGRPFFTEKDEDTGKPVHVTAEGRRYTEADAYFDPSVLFHVPRHFDRKRPFRIVVYFHGHESVLEEDVVRMSGLTKQVDRSDTNAVLIAPQLAYAAVDAHPGKLIRPGALARMLDEAGGILGRAMGGDFERRIAHAPVVLVAFSAGYLPLVRALSREDGGDRLVDRIEGVVLLDAIYGDIARLDRWLEARQGRVFLVGLYGRSSRRWTSRLFERWEDRNLESLRHLPDRIGPGTVAIARVWTKHPAIINDGPPRDPVAAILSRLARPR